MTGTRALSLLLLAASAVAQMATSRPEAALPPEPTGAFLESPGATIYYEVLGDKHAAGEPLVVVHGGLGLDHSYLEGSLAWNLLAKKRRVVFYDQRGDGRSPALKASQSCSLADEIADLEALRAHLGAPRIDLLGHSWGGFLAMAYAIHHPEHISRLILVDSVPPNAKDMVSVGDALFPEESAKAAALEKDDPTSMRSPFEALFPTLFYSPEHRAAFMKQMTSFRFDEEVFHKLGADLMQANLYEGVRRFQFPVLILNGRFDVLVAPQSAVRIANAIPGSKLIFFERSGHLPFLEEPDRFAETTEEFLAQPQ